MKTGLSRLTAVAVLFGMTCGVSAAPTGGFFAVLDADQNNSDSSKSIVIYDVDDPGNPLFAMYVGWKGAVLQTVLGTTVIIGDHRSPDALTVDPATGNLFVLARDSDDASGATRPQPGFEDDFDAGNVPDSTEGDYDLLKFDFQTVYNHWEANQATFQNDFGETYVTFVSDPVDTNVVNSVGTPAFQNAARAGSPANKNEVLFAGFLTKVGEVANPVVDITDIGDDQHLEFVDDDTFLLVDTFTADLQDPDPQTGDRGPNDLAANDREVRVLKRVGLTGSENGGGTATEPNPPLTDTEGGWNLGTNESWESTILGLVNLDQVTTSEVVSTAFYSDSSSGVKGVWIAESDGVGDEIAFFEVVNEAGDDTGGGGANENGYRPFVGGSPVLNLDDPKTGTADDGDASGIHVNPMTGDVVIIESDFNDTIQGEPSVQVIDIISYDTAGEIEVGGTTTFQLDFSDASGIPDVTVPDDDTQVVDARRTVFDWQNNDVYFYDFDSTAAGAGGSFVFDWYRLDLDTGVITFAELDVDESTRGFSTEDRYEFFFLAQAVLLGDANNDGQVTGADLIAVQQNFGNTGPNDGLLLGDANDDGQVTGADLIAVQQNFGNVLGPAAVPEPASLALLGLGALALLRRRAA